MLLHRIFLVVILITSTLVLAACGRNGAPLRPAPGVIIMDQDASDSAEPSEDKPFILDPLL